MDRPEPKPKPLSQILRDATRDRKQPAASIIDRRPAAVRQWRYRPTLLGGRAVPVRMTVTVRFDPR